ncbi:endoribonuclease ysh1 [Binucleata daphniae]
MNKEKIIFMPLGAGAEVGRSCMYLKYNNTQILFDIGIHPAHTGNAALPFLDLIDLSQIDALFVTHFHLDHAGALPYVTERTTFKGKVYMTHPTKAILKYLLNDYTRLVNASSELDFYTEKDLNNCYNKIISIDYHQEVTVKEFRICALNAGHVLGAAMFFMKIKKTLLLYTGDYSREEDRHLKPAESPGKINILISESTYGVQCHLPREEREKRFTGAVKEIVMRGGKVLLPVFALGRAQELLLILEEFWQKNEELQKIPIFYASALAKRCIGIYQTYSLSNKKVSFDFQYIKNITRYEDTKKPCVVMASPGMLQSGLSRELFEKWCEDKKNGVIVPGYCVNGTLAKEIANEPSEIESVHGGKLKLNCSVDFISFSAHVDFLENAKFIKECDPMHLFLVHGEANEALRLKNALKRENVHCLKNGESYAIEIVKEKTAKMKNVVCNKVFEAIYKSNGEDCEIINKEDLKEICLIQKVKVKDSETLKKALEANKQLENNETKNINQGEEVMQNSEIKQKSKIAENDNYTKMDKQLLDTDCTENLVNKNSNDISKNIKKRKIPYNAKYTLIKNALFDFFGTYNEDEHGIIIDNIKIQIFEDEVQVEWKSGYVNDLTANTIIKVIQNIGHSIESVKISKLNKEDTLIRILKNHYIDVTKEDNKIVVKDGMQCAIIENEQISGSGKIKEKVSEIAETVFLIFK